jgi:hypothetical protein
MAHKMRYIFKATGGFWDGVSRSMCLLQQHCHGHKNNNAEGRHRGIYLARSILAALNSLYIWGTSEQVDIHLAMNASFSAKQSYVIQAYTLFCNLGRHEFK